MTTYESLTGNVGLRSLQDGQGTNDLITNGKVHWLEYGMPLWYTASEAFHPQLGRCTRFRLILVEKGNGIINLNQRRGGVIAPALICLNEKDRIELATGADLQARAIYFHPCVINGSFDFEKVRNCGEMEMTESQDVFWLNPFLQRSEAYKGVINLGPNSVRRAASLFDHVVNQLHGQPDSGWPCRTRSYFLELLFYTERLYSSPESTTVLPVRESSTDVDAMILYLFTHYQDKLTLSELTRTFHTNRTTLTRQFHDTTGLPVISYLNHLRIQMAAVMLRDTHLSVSEIVERVGFRDMTHFVRTFRKQTGFSPSEYRQRYCWM